MNTAQFYNMLNSHGTGIKKVTAVAVSNIAYTVEPNVNVIIVDTAAAAFTVNLPNAVEYPGRIIVSVCGKGTNTLTVADTGSSDVVDAAGDAVVSISTGMSWIRLGKYEQ